MPRRSPYDRFFSRYRRTTVQVLTSREPTEALLDKWWRLELRRRHWEEHETEIFSCHWCDRFPSSVGIPHLSSEDF